ncbi:MAG: 50S ribosomal protein L5 [Clostridia bacterium]|nr:50S ribosomal protein L5 [Clostridia bacterium]
MAKQEKNSTLRLKEHYINQVVPALIKSQGYKNVNQAPKVVKVILNAGLGDVKDNSKSFDKAVEELAIITGQKPKVITAKRSVANFKLREGMKIAAKVTLRGDRMYEFLDRLISYALPRVRDFNGLSTKSFDGRGNYAMGVKEQLIFPEISYDKIEKVRGFDIMIITTANSDDEARELLLQMGLPFKKQG